MHVCSFVRVCLYVSSVVCVCVCICVCVCVCVCMHGMVGQGRVGSVCVACLQLRCEEELQRAPHPACVLPYLLHFQPRLDALRFRSDVISSTKSLYLCRRSGRQSIPKRKTPSTTRTGVRARARSFCLSLSLSLCLSVSLSRTVPLSLSLCL